MKDQNEVAPPKGDSLLSYFNSEKTRAGDILLNTDPDSWLSAAIRAVTRSPISHAAICTESGFFVEAIGLGVRRFLLEIMAIEKPEAVRFLRLRDDYPDAEQVGIKAGKKAENYLSHPFWRLGMTTAIVQDLALDPGGQFFCSHLVAQAYREAGVELVAGLEPSKVKPADLLSCPLLQDITGQIVQPPGPRARWRPARPMERGGPETPHDQEIILTQAIHRRLAAVFRAHGLPEPENFWRALGALWRIPDKSLAAKLDKEFARILREEGYLNLADVAMGKMAPAIAQPDLVASILRKGGWDRNTIEDVLDQSRRLHTLMRRSAEENAQGLEGFRRKFEETSLETFALLAELYDRQRGLGEAGLESLAKTIQLLEQALR